MNDSPTIHPVPPPGSRQERHTFVACKVHHGARGQALQPSKGLSSSAARQPGSLQKWMGYPFLFSLNSSPRQGLSQSCREQAVRFV